MISRAAHQPSLRIAALAARCQGSLFPGIVSPVDPRLRRRTSVAMAASIGSKQEMLSTTGVHRNPDASTKDFIMQQTMLRITDPEVSLKFYTEVLGMTLLLKLDFPDSKFSLYFLGYCKEEDIPEDAAERVAWAFKQPGTIELTHNHGTESDGTKFHSGNEEPKGFGHIGIAVPDVYAACERFEKLGVPFQKKPDGGSMKGIAFIKDPTGYWIEILSSSGMRDFAA